METKKKEFLNIAIPAILEGLVTVLITNIDTEMISGLGAPAISAVSFTSQPKLVFFAIFFALGAALSFFVARAKGRGDEEEANCYFHTILKITILSSVILGVLLWFLAGPIMRLCNRQQDSFEMSVAFFRIIMGFMIFQTVSIVINAALRGIGKTKVTLISNIAMGFADIVFNYLLIEGHLGFPRLEIRGDAIATVMGSVAACAVSMIAILARQDILHFKGIFRKLLISNREIIREIVSKAGNIIFENLFVRIGFLVSSIIVSLLPSEETALYAVAMILLNYSFAFADGIQSAVVALTGRSHGARDYDSFERYARTSVIHGLFCAGMLALIYMSTARLYYGSFFDDGKTIKEGFVCSGIVSVITVMQIIRIAETGIMRGMGEVKDPRRIASCCVLIVNPLLSWLLAFVAGFGIWGIWLSSVITQGLWMLASIVLCRKHRKKLRCRMNEDEK